jgi:hypothetical protein
MNHARRNIRVALAKHAESPWIRARVFMAAGDLAYKEESYDRAAAFYESGVAQEDLYGGEGQQYQFSPGIGLAYLNLYKSAKEAGQLEDARHYLASAESQFRSLAERAYVTAGKLYGQYGRALIAYIEKKSDDTREEVLRVRSDLERQGSSSLLKVMIDKFLVDFGIV